MQQAPDVNQRGALVVSSSGAEEIIIAAVCAAREGPHLEKHECDHNLSDVLKMRLVCRDEPVDDGFLWWATCVASAGNKPAASGAGGSYESSTLKGPPAPSCCILKLT